MLLLCVVDPSTVREAADISLMCQGITKWSKACLMRASRESNTLVTVDREAHFRSLTEQAKSAEYHGMTREAAGQPRIKPIPSITMEDHTTMTVGSVQTDQRWSQYFAKLLQGRVTTLADLRARSTSCLQRTGSCLQEVRFSEREVRTAIMRKKNGKSPGFDDIPVELFKAGGDKMVSLLCSLFHGVLEQGCIPLWFQGTRMCPLWKGKADPRRCSNHRGTQVSNVIPSILIEVVKTRAEEKLQSSHPTPSAGANMDAQHSPCTLPAVSCSMQQVEVTTRVCLSQTLKKLTTWLREMAVGCRCTEADLASQLQCLGFDGDVLQWCFDHLRCGASVMQEACFGNCSG